MHFDGIVPTSRTSGNVTFCEFNIGGITLVDGYAIGVIAFLALSVTVGTLTSRLVKKSEQTVYDCWQELAAFFRRNHARGAIYRW